MKKHFSQAALAAAMVSVLAACGGGGGGGGSDGPTPGNGSGGGSSGAPTSTTINGSATKGLIVGAPVKAYEVLSSGLSTSAVGTATTNSSGEYSLTLGADYKGGPLRIVIEGGSGVTMICDIPAGCGGVAFGQPAPLAANFRLGAVVPAPTGNTVSVHITPLADLADKLAAKNGYSAARIAEANDVIRQAFSLGFDITSVKPVDITKVDSTAAGSANAQQIALLSAAILAAVDAQGSGSSLEEKLAAFATAVANGNGLVANDTDTQQIVSVQDILAAAQAVSTKAKAKAAGEGKSLDLTAVDMNLAVKLSEVAAKSASDEPTVLKPVDTVTKSNVDKAKALAADLRTIATAASLKTGATQFGDQVQQAFGDQLDLVTAVAGSPLGNLLQRTGYAADALGEASQAFDHNRALTSFVLPAVTGEHEAITVTIAPGTDSNATFAIDQTIDGAAVKLTATVRLVVQETEGDGASTLDGNASLDLSGSVNDGTLELAIAEGKVALVNVHSSEVSGESHLGFEKASFALDATVRQVTATNPVQFNGQISAAIDNASSSDSFTSQTSLQTRVETQTQKLTVKKLAASLKGTFSDAQQHSVSAQFAVNLSNPNGVEFTKTDESEERKITLSGGAFFYYPYWSNSTSSFNETADNYAGLSVAAGLTASLPGVDSAATLLIDGQRTGLKAGVVTAKISFAGKSITVAGNSATGLLTIANQDGVLISATQPAEGEDWSGELKIGDAKVATLETTNKGIVILRYTDGSFESLM